MLLKCDIIQISLSHMIKVGDVRLNPKGTCTSQENCCSIMAVRREEQETLAALPVGHSTGRDHGGNVSNSVGSCPCDPSKT